MSLQPSAEGSKVNWINYKTGIRHLSFRMEADHKTAFTGIVISHPDSALRELMYEQLLALKPVLQQYLAENWSWEPEVADEYGKMLSRAGCRIEGVNIFRQEDWPALISFFKPRIMALDAFWGEAQYGFDLFR